MFAGSPPHTHRRQWAWGPERVTHWWHYKVSVADVVELELETGETVAVTRNHKMFRPDGTVVLAGDVVPGDDLMGEP